MSQEVKWRWMPRVRWPDYLFRVTINAPEAVEVCNRIIAVQHRARLLW